MFRNDESDVRLSAMAALSGSPLRAGGTLGVKLRMREPVTSGIVAIVEECICPSLLS